MKRAISGTKRGFKTEPVPCILPVRSTKAVAITWVEAEMTDIELLQEYAKSQSEAAFAEIVKRHAGAVYASALRQLRDPSLAEEVVQAVFILLARKAAGFKPGIVLSGWLFRATHFAANDILKAEFRRQRRETTAYHMNPTDASTPAPETDESLWERVAPILDHCLSRLADADRHALLLRFFQNKSLAEVGAALGIAEDAARKRVSRAVERLHGLLRQNGATVPADSLSPLLTGRSASAVPSGLAAATIAAAVCNGSSAKASTATLATTVSRQFFLVQLKQWVAIGAATTVGATAITLGYNQFQPEKPGTTAAIQIPLQDDYRLAGFADARVVHHFIAELQERAQKGDRASIAKMVRFPLPVHSREGTLTLENEADLIARFDGIFGPAIVNIVLKCPRSGLYCDARGVMIGSGEVWLAPEETEPRIIALNLP